MVLGPRPSAFGRHGDIIWCFQLAEATDITWNEDTDITWNGLTMIGPEVPRDLRRA